jgi:hypothetical protein
LAVELSLDITEVFAELDEDVEFDELVFKVGALLKIIFSLPDSLYAPHVPFVDVDFLRCSKLTLFHPRVIDTCFCKFSSEFQISWKLFKIANLLDLVILIELEAQRNRIFESNEGEIGAFRAFEYIVKFPLQHRLDERFIVSVLLPHFASQDIAYDFPLVFRFGLLWIGLDNAESSLMIAQLNDI